MSLGAVLYCDRGDQWGTCTAQLHLSSFNPSAIRKQALRRGWEYSESTGGALCPRHTYRRRVAS